MEKSSSNIPSLILASASPRRRGFFEQLGYAFDVRVPRTEEKPEPGESAADYVMRNAGEKAEAVVSGLPDGITVVAADTVVVLDGRIMEKPGSEEGAREMLESLSGRTHQVMTAFCVCRKESDGTETRRSDLVSTDVEFKELSLSEIAAYIHSGEPMDKAGAYAIQGGAAYMVRQIRGSYTNVVGLPLTELVGVLAETFGIRPPFHAPEE